MRRDMHIILQTHAEFSWNIDSGLNGNHGIFRKDAIGIAYAYSRTFVYFNSETVAQRTSKYSPYPASLNLRDGI
jgi:hypothetical protein